MKLDPILSDKDILNKSFDNPKYFELLVDRYQEVFLRKSMSIVHSKEEAEDIVQETFLKIYKFGNNFREREGASFRSWAFEILRNTCFSYYKRQKRYASQTKLVDFSENDFEDNSTPFLESVTNERKSNIESVLSSMPETLANVLRLYFLEEKSQKEIAEIENISLGAVRTRVHRAKDFFRNIITNIV